MTMHHYQINCSFLEHAIVGIRVLLLVHPILLNHTRVGVESM